MRDRDRDRETETGKETDREDWKREKERVEKKRKGSSPVHALRDEQAQNSLDQEVADRERRPGSKCH